MTCDPRRAGPMLTLALCLTALSFATASFAADSRPATMGGTRTGGHGSHTTTPDQPSGVQGRGADPAKPFASLDDGVRGISNPLPRNIPNQRWFDTEAGTYVRATP